MNPVGDLWEEARHVRARYNETRDPAERASLKARYRVLEATLKRLQELPEECDPNKAVRKSAQIIEADDDIALKVQVCHERFGVSWATSDACRGIVSTLDAGHPLVLLRDPGNRYDPYAVKVFTVKGRLVGYVPSYATDTIGPKLDDGYSYKAVVTRMQRTEQGNVPQVEVELHPTGTDTPGFIAAGGIPWAAVQRRRETIKTFLILAFLILMVAGVRGCFVLLF